jgi:hypothetical protein
LIIQYIQGVVSSGGVDNPPKATPPNIDISPQPNLDSIYKYIDNKLDNLEDVSIQDIDNKIAESLEDGDIKDAISNSYAAVMGQFNGLLEELQALQKQVQSNPPAPVPQPQINEELTIDNEEPTTDNGQLTNEILTTLQETDDGQFSDNSPAPIPTKNQTDYVKKKLKKINIEKTAAQIREAFINLGFDGTNYEDLRGEVIEFLSNE